MGLRLGRLYRKLAKGHFLVYDNLSGRHAYACRQFLERSQWFRKSELQKLRFWRLKALVKHAYRNVPYYHETFKKAGFRPDDLKSLDDVHRIPVLRKSALREQPERLLARNVSKSDLLLWKTSGTTAAPVPLWRGKRDVGWGVGAELRGYAWAGYEIGDEKAYLWNIKPEDARSFWFRLENLVRRYKVMDVHRLSESLVKAFAETLHKHKPSFVRGYASATNLLAAFLLHNPQYVARCKAVFTTGCRLVPAYRRNIEDAFGCKVYDYYACTEASHVAAQCGECEGLHVSEENVMLEVTRDHEPVSAGEEGEILLTNLHGYAMPFIRYDIGDLGRLLPDSCPCGRELSLMKIVGRTYEYFVNSDGSFTTLRDFETVFEDLPIQEFQVVQETLDDIVIKIVPKAGYSQHHTDFILKNIRIRGDARIRVELVDSLPLEGSGKIRHAVSRVAAWYT